MLMMNGKILSPKKNDLLIFKITPFNEILHLW